MAAGISDKSNKDKSNKDKSNKLEDKFDVDISDEKQLQSDTHLNDEVVNSDNAIVSKDMSVMSEQSFDEPITDKSSFPYNSGPSLSRRMKASDVTQIPTFPKALMRMIRQEIQGANSNSEALTAWVYVKSGKKVDVDDGIKELAKSYKDSSEEDILKTVLEKLSRIEKLSFSAATNIVDDRYILEWLLLERMDEIASPRIDSIDFTQPSFDHLREILRVKLQQAKNMQRARNGRPIR